MRWSRGNLSEFLPGVLTPLTWDFWRNSERAGRRIFYRLGLADRSELSPPEDPAERTTNIFHGCPVANVDALRGFVDRAPGDAGNSFERQLLGETDLPPAPRRAQPRKRPLRIMWKGGLWFRSFPAELRRMVEATGPWWRGIITRAETATLDDCKAMLREIVERLIDVSVVAGFGTLGGQLAFARLDRLLPASHRDVLPSLVSGGAGLAEIQLLDALWEVAQKKRSRADFLATHGFYGPGVGECSQASWREDPSPLEAAIEAFRVNSGSPAPSHQSRMRAERARKALAALAAHLPCRHFARLGKAIAQVDKFTVWREAGKACSLQTYDAMRATVRRIGAVLQQSGHLANANDAFYFTVKELSAAPFDGMDATAMWRRARRTFNATLEIPDAFIGPPIARAKRIHAHGDVIGEQMTPGETLHGIGVSPGVVEATARVVYDSGGAQHLRAGEILVCVVTDPAWAALFARAGGVVTDIGGMLSHGAVVARELNLPCVVNSRGGTRRIPDGARIRIDGTSGEVTILAVPGVQMEMRDAV